MKVITVKELEDNFEEILADVEVNKTHYRIQAEGGDVMLIPFESYEVLSDVYEVWIKEPKAVDNPPDFTVE